MVDTSGLPPIYEVTAESVYVNLMIYADPGAGKTTLAAMANEHPAMREVLFANVEGGLLSVTGQGIHAIDINSVDDLEALYWELVKGKEGSLGHIRTVVIDSGSEVQSLNLEEIVAEEIEEDEKGKRYSQDDIWLSDYGRSTAQLKRVFRWFRDLDCHLIITALAKTIMPPQPQGRGKGMSQSLAKQPDRDPKSVDPLFTEKLGNAVKGYVDFVWYIYEDSNEDGDPERWILTQRQGPIFAKTRGARFRTALGPHVKIKDMENEGDDGMTLGDIFDLLIKTQGPKKKRTRKTPAKKASAKKKPAAKRG